MSPWVHQSVFFCAAFADGDNKSLCGFQRNGQILFFPIHLPRAFPQSPSILGAFRNLIYELANRRPPRFNKWRCRCLSIYNLQSGKGRKEGLLISLLLLPSSRRSWLGRKYPRFSTLSWEFGKLLLMGKPAAAAAVLSTLRSATSSSKLRLRLRRRLWVGAGRFDLWRSPPKRGAFGWQEKGSVTIFSLTCIFIPGFSYSSPSLPRL